MILRILFFSCINFIFVGVIFYLSYKLIKYNRVKIDTFSIKKLAKELGLDDKSLTTNLGGIDTNHYDLLLRIRSEQMFRSSIFTSIIAIVSSVAAVISALCALYLILFQP